MAKKQSNKKNRIITSQQVDVDKVPTGGAMHTVRETVESIVIAFVLAFLFRTFEAEAFVIPTGSMSPSLQGQHKDVECSECGYRFRLNASSEGEDRQQLIAYGSPKRDVDSVDVLTGQCPMCRQTMLMRPDIPTGVPAYIDAENVEKQASYPGDRILVDKFAYTYNDPQRWDVVVFRFPGNGEMNYIKRLIGLPNETLQIFQGDVFIRNSSSNAKFEIARKPADKVRAMLQQVHDTDYDPSILYNAGWPLRWEADKNAGWRTEAKAGAQNVAQQFRVEPSAAVDADFQWLRYRHYVPQNIDWEVARKHRAEGQLPEEIKQRWMDQIQPELIRDFNSYNTSQLRGGRTNSHGKQQLRGVLDRGGWSVPEDRYSLHWVGDLAVDCQVDVEKSQGELELDLVEAGKHFYCRINLETGQATVGVRGSEEFSTTAPTDVQSPGSYRLLFANVDDQLLLWVDDELIQLSQPEAGLNYEAVKIYGERENALPVSSEGDLADLAPVGIGARGASLTVNRLQVLRDIYYVATNEKLARSNRMCDYPHPSYPFELENGNRVPAVGSVRELFTSPELWSRFSMRRKVTFDIEEKQLFVMGDNSPASQDCRLWADPQSNGSEPGGSYLDRRLLIGKAVCVFWPHSWGSIPGASKLPGFPNFGDMRLVR